MRIETISLLIAVILGVIYVIAMMAGVLPSVPYGLIGLVLPFVLGFLFYRVFRVPNDDNSNTMSEEQLKD